MNEDNFGSQSFERQKGANMYMVARKPGEFRKGDKVRVIKKIDSDNCYGVGDEFYIIRQGRGSTLGPTFKCSLCLNGPYEYSIYSDELELVE